MKSKFKSRLSLVCIILGAALVLAAAVYAVHSMVSTNNATASNKQLVSLAEQLMPQVTDAYPEERGNNTMPTHQLGGVNVAGVLEMPAYNVKFPLRSAWSKTAVKSSPCVYTGSIYNKTLVIGAVTANGQFDFVGDISVEDKLLVTDMSGDRYTYTVSSIKRATRFNAEAWQAENAALTVFVEDAFTGEYTVIYCSVQ